jgi:hypothetical protein
MKRLFILITCVLVIMLTTTRCYYESEEHLFPSLNSCDTTNVTYAGSVLSIINESCYPCHGNSTYSISGFNLQDTSVFRAQINSGQIVRSITYQSHPMPQSSQLPSCQITILKKWINSGAPFK